MSLEALLSDEPLCTLCRSRTPGETDAAGIPLTDPIVDIRPIVGRLDAASARQVEKWMGLGVTASYEFLTQDADMTQELGIGLGKFIRSFDGRLFQVMSGGDIVYGKGRLPTNYSYALEEQRVR